MTHRHRTTTWILISPFSFNPSIRFAPLTTVCPVLLPTAELFRGLTGLPSFSSRLPAENVPEMDMADGGRPGTLGGSMLLDADDGTRDIPPGFMDVGLRDMMAVAFPTRPPRLQVCLPSR